MMKFNRSSLAFCRMLARTTSATVGVIGLAVLAGWLFGVPMLKSLAPGWPDMQPNTAVALLLAAGALWPLTAQRDTADVRPHAWARMVAAGVALIGGLTLVQYLFHVNVGIDGLLFRDVGDAATQWLARMSPFAASALVLLGIALFLIAGPSRQFSVWTAHLLSFLATLGAFVVLTRFLQDRGRQAGVGSDGHLVA